MIKDSEVVKAFEVLHDYCDERECDQCIFLNDNGDDRNVCDLRNFSPAYLRAEEIQIVTYKIRRGA